MFLRNDPFNCTDGDLGFFGRLKDLTGMGNTLKMMVTLTKTDRDKIVWTALTALSIIRRKLYQIHDSSLNPRVS